jgi:molybdenum cofactor cytidylyltransferase
MIFAELPVGETEGALLAHSIKLPAASFKKGRRLSAEDVAKLIEVGRTTVIVARLEPGDIGENDAATRVAAAAQGPHLDRAVAFTGRCNLLAEATGLLVVDRERLDRINLLDEAVTIATLPPYDLVEPRQMAATVKIIPFAVADAVLARCEAIAQESGPLIRVAAFRPRPMGLIQTRLPGVKESVLDKTVGTMNARLAALGCGALATERRCDHDEKTITAEIDALRREGIELLLLLGASAITDRRDVIPAAIERAGGAVEHFGMPVDPGNLLLLARIGAMDVLGVPGSTRSPKLSGVDWVLRRLLADIPVTGQDIMRMGVGGLLKEIPARPQPRAGTERGRAEALHSPRVAAILLAAGRSSRMGAANKLLTEIDGIAMVARACEAALASQADPVVVVTGHDSQRVRTAIENAAEGRPVTIVHNPDYAAGISTSLRHGLAALGPEADGALICLADMPRVTAAVLNRLIAAFDPAEGRAICVPVWNGKRGNPVLWSRRFFPEMSALAGDVGARHLIGEHGDLVREVAMTDDAVLLDVDTPEALAALARPDRKPA